MARYEHTLKNGIHFFHHLSFFSKNISLRLFFQKVGCSHSMREVSGFFCDFDQSQILLFFINVFLNEDRVAVDNDALQPAPKYGPLGPIPPHMH